MNKTYEEMTYIEKKNYAMRPGQVIHFAGLRYVWFKSTEGEIYLVDTGDGKWQSNTDWPSAIMDRVRAFGYLQLAHHE